MVARVLIPDEAATPEQLAALGASLQDVIAASVQAAVDDLTAAINDILVNGAPPIGGAGGVLSGEFPNPDFAVNMAEQSELDQAVSDFTASIADLTDQLSAKWGAAETNAAITTVVNSAIAALVDTAPDALNTLRELAEALQDEEDAVAALTTLVASKANTADVNASLALKADGAALTTEQNTRIAAVTALQAADTALQNADTTLGNRATALEGRATAVENRATAVEGRATALEASNVVLLTTKFSSSQQEGGTTVMQGEFIPLRSDVTFDINLSGYSATWGGAMFVFNIGVLPAVPPASPEGGAKPTKITDAATNGSRVALPGVTEYSNNPIGQMAPGAACSNVSGIVKKTGLTVGRTYQWEVRFAGISYYKEHVFPAGWNPTYLSPVPGDETFLMVGNAGTPKLSMVNLGWGGIWNYENRSTEMVRHYDITVPAAILGIEMQKNAAANAAKGRYCLVMHQQSVSIVDTWTPVVVGTYALPGGAHNTMSVKSDRAGNYFYVGCVTGHVHRFNISTLSFDAQFNLPAADYAVVFGTDQNDSFLWVSSMLLARMYRIDLGTSAVGAGFANPLDAGGNPVLLSGGSTAKDGKAVGMDLTNGKVYILNATTAAVVATTDVTGGTATAGYTDMAPDDERYMFVRGNRAGWAWLDTGKRINYGNFGGGTTMGNISNTDSEGTSIAIPGQSKVIHWPGGVTTIDPSINDPISFGAQHAIVRVNGATINGG